MDGKSKRLFASVSSYKRAFFLNAILNVDIFSDTAETTHGARDRISDKTNRFFVVSLAGSQTARQLRDAPGCLYRVVAVTFARYDVPFSARSNTILSSTFVRSSNIKSDRSFTLRGHDTLVKCIYYRASGKVVTLFFFSISFFRTTVSQVFVEIMTKRSETRRKEKVSQHIHFTMCTMRLKNLMDL